MNKLEFRMDIPAVTREYTPGSCRNSTTSLQVRKLEIRVTPSLIYQTGKHEERWEPIVLVGM